MEICWVEKRAYPYIPLHVFMGFLFYFKPFFLRRVSEPLKGLRCLHAYVRGTGFKPLVQGFLQNFSFSRQFFVIWSIEWFELVTSLVFRCKNGKIIPPYYSTASNGSSGKIFKTNRQLHFFREKSNFQHFPPFVLQLAPVTGHGYMINPPGRNCMWRVGFPCPVNYNDNELFCGGYVGKCQKI